MSAKHRPSLVAHPYNWATHWILLLSVRLAHSRSVWSIKTLTKFVFQLSSLCSLASHQEIFRVLTSHCKTLRSKNLLLSLFIFSPETY